MTKIDITKFHLPQDGDDFAPACARALKESEGCSEVELFFPHGEYHVYDRTQEEFFTRVCNNDSVMRRALFRIVERKNITINGNGSLLITHGRLTPFVIDRCENVTVRDLRVDTVRPFFTQGTVLRAEGDELVLKIDQDCFPTDTRGENLLFCSDCWEYDGTEGAILVQEFDPVTGAPARDALTSFVAIGDGVQNTENLPVPLWRLRATRLSDDEFLLKGERTYNPKVGNVLVMTHEIRTVGGVFIFDSRNIRADGVTIHQSAAMPFLAQFSENVTVENCRVFPTPETPRIISTNADAAHFVHCTGTVRVENCRFESMMDDVINIHGMYTVVKQACDGKIFLDLVHYQQKGINMFFRGDTITVRDRENLSVVRELPVLDSYLESDDILVVEVSDSDGVVPGQICENVGRMPTVILRGIRGGNNRPRGFVVSSPKPMLIENNVLFNYQACIDIPGDANFWFEAGGVRDVVIRNNVFIHHNALHAVSAIKIKPDFNCPINDYHQNILIENNHFFGNNPRLLDAACVDGLTFKGNTYRAPLYDETGMEVYRIRTANCGKLEIEEN